jgi:hypothetical protein
MKMSMNLDHNNTDHWQICDDCGKRIEIYESCQYYNNDLGIRCAKCAENKMYKDWRNEK